MGCDPVSFRMYLKYKRNPLLILKQKVHLGIWTIQGNKPWGRQPVYGAILPSQQYRTACVHH